MKKLKVALSSIVFVLFVTVPLMYSSEPETVGKYRVGCVCCDGTESSSTKSGACSYHGGVKYWIYYDDNTGLYSYKYTGNCY